METGCQLESRTFFEKKKKFENLKRLLKENQKQFAVNKMDLENSAENAKNSQNLDEIDKRKFR